ncbi:MAG: hypothetical protein Ta2A_25160 [Treponemataceae bacterium]|nr:MAG: hypothetical protein Ta2A_25160 [Treponemataceae bacterium]
MLPWGNDNCFVEQKNDKGAREYIGYDRLTTAAELHCVNKVYESLNPLLNFCMPQRNSMKLESKSKVGAKKTRKRDRPRSPYARLMESDTLSEDVKVNLTRLYARYNPVALQYSVNLGVIALRDEIERKLSPRL